MRKLGNDGESGRRSGVVGARLQQALNPRDKKEEWRGLSFTDGDEDTVAARNRGGDAGEIGAQVRVQVRYECKGESRSPGSSLNMSQERRRRGEAEGLGGGRRLPLMAAAISARGLRKGNGPN
jgi:RNA 3'-terminal phosphate cyclase